MARPRSTINPDTAIAQLERIKEQNRKDAAAHKARMDALTRLEQAAFLERKNLGEGFDPYTSQERATAERIQRKIAELQNDAQILQLEVTNRLTQQATDDPRAAVLLEKFQGMRGVRVELTAY